MPTPTPAVLLALLVLPVLVALLAPAVLLPTKRSTPPDCVKLPFKSRAGPVVLVATLASAPALEMAVPEVLQPVIFSVPPD